MLNYINYILFGLSFFGVLIFAIISFLEAEKRAFKVLLLFLIFPFIFIIPIFLPTEISDIVSVILHSVILLALLISIVPIRNFKKYKNYLPKERIDERDTMFSRFELDKDSEDYDKYYQKNPDKLEKDNKFRKNPGLMAEKTTYYNPLFFKGGDASFKIIKSMHPLIDGEIATKKTEVNKKEITSFIKNWILKNGANNVGVTLLKDYHLYSHSGRGKYYNEKVELPHKYAIAFSIEMDYNFIKTAPKAPTVFESAEKYLDSGVISIQIAEFIRSLGYEARAHVDGNYKLVAPLVGKDAGIGELGRMGLLMTPNLGPRVRLGILTTNLPLETEKTTFDSTMVDFCTYCKKCAHVCPSQAISYEERKDVNGVIRWQIDQEACFTYWTKAGTDCARCIAVCPYSHDDNVLHSLVRIGIKNSAIFRQVAIKLDDVLYGKKPKSAKVSDLIDKFHL